MWDFSAFLTVDGLAALLALTTLEIVLGIDNVVFIAILTGRLPKEKQVRTRNIGLLLAMVMRIGLLLGIAWIMSLTKTLFTVLDFDVTGKDLVLLFGGLFLIGKATHEIHHKIEEAGRREEKLDEKAKAYPSVSSIIVQILMIDLVFSLDSVITAVGMTDIIPIMITAIVISIGVMIAFAGVISAFIERHPTLKMLALSFLILIGVMLVYDGVADEGHFPRGYIYFAMVFSLVVEVLNMKAGMRRKGQRDKGAEGQREDKETA